VRTAPPVYGGILVGYVLLAARAFAGPRVIRLVNRATGVVMAGAATIATRS
jgi:hypothetical protein